MRQYGKNARKDISKHSSFVIEGSAFFLLLDICYMTKVLEVGGGRAVAGFQMRAYNAWLKPFIHYTACFLFASVSTILLKTCICTNWTLVMIFSLVDTDRQTKFARNISDFEILNFHFHFLFLYYFIFFVLSFFSFGILLRAKLLL